MCFGRGAGAHPSWCSRASQRNNSRENRVRPIHTEGALRGTRAPPCAYEHPSRCSQPTRALRALAWRPQMIRLPVQSWQGRSIDLSCSAYQHVHHVAEELLQLRRSLFVRHLRLPLLQNLSTPPPKSRRQGGSLFGPSRSARRSRNPLRAHVRSRDPTHRERTLNTPAVLLQHEAQQLICQAQIAWHMSYNASRCNHLRAHHLLLPMLTDTHLGANDELVGGAEHFKQVLRFGQDALGHILKHCARLHHLVDVCLAAIANTTRRSARHTCRP
jgi:hypothetical protein